MFWLNAKWKTAPIFVLKIDENLIFFLNGSQPQKEHRGLRCMNVAGSVIGCGPEVQASRWSVTFIIIKTTGIFEADRLKNQIGYIF